MENPPYITPYNKKDPRQKQGKSSHFRQSVQWIIYRPCCKTDKPLGFYVLATSVSSLWTKVKQPSQ